MDVSWTIKKAEHQRIDAFETARTARRSNQCILKEISPEYSLEGLMLKLKLQYLATWCVRGTNSLEKTLMLGKMEGRRRGQQRMRCLDGHRRLDELEWASSGSWWWTGSLSGCSPWGHYDWVTELNWILWMLTASTNAYIPMTSKSYLQPKLSHCTLYPFFSCPLHISQSYGYSNTVF